MRKIFLRERDLFHFFEVRLQADAHTVERHRRLAIGFKQAVFKRFLLRLNFTVAEQRLLRGVDDHEAIVAIDEDPITGLHPLGEIAHPDDGRHLHGTRDDHRVAGLAARVHHDAERRTAIDARRVRRREIVRHDDAFFRELTQTVFRLPEEVLQHPLRDITNVSSAFPQVFVINLGKRLDVARGDVVKTRFYIPPRLFKFPDRLPDQRLIFEHQQMRVENQRLGFAQIFLHLVLYFRDLLPRREQGLIKTRDLLDAFFQVHLITRHLDIALQIHKYRAIGDALRGGDALHDDFWLMPRVR